MNELSAASLHQHGWRALHASGWLQHIRAVDPRSSQALMIPISETSVVCYRVVNVWEWTGVAADEGDEAAAWFSKYLDTPVRLVR